MSKEFVRKPVPITGMPEALNYVSPFQQAEFEERLLDKKVEEFPIAMLMSYLGHHWYGSGMFFCGSIGYHGFVDYCREVTDKQILQNNVYTGITTEPGTWNSRCSVLAIDWKHEKICMGPKSISFQGLTLRQFDNLLRGDKVRFYHIPGSDTLEGHGVNWTCMYGQGLAPGGKYTIPEKYFYKVEEHCDYCYSAIDFIMDFWRPWYLLPEEYEEIKRRQKEKEEEDQKLALERLSEDDQKDKKLVSRNYKIKSFERQKGYYVVKHLDIKDDMENMHINVLRVDNVELVKNEDFWNMFYPPTNSDKRVKRVVHIKKDKKVPSSHVDAGKMFCVGKNAQGYKCMKEVRDQDVVKTTYSVIMYGFGENEAYELQEYTPINVWEPYDSPDKLRVSTMPTESPYNSVSKYKSWAFEFTVTGDVLKQVFKKLNRFKPMDAIIKKFKRFQDVMEEAKNAPKYLKPSDEELQCKIHPPYAENNMEPYMFYRKKAKGGKQAMIVNREGLYEEEAEIYKQKYPKAEIDKLVKNLRKKYLNKWVSRGRCYMRIDDIFPLELMRNYYLKTFEKEIGDNYVIPTIMFNGPSVEMDYWHPKCDLEDSANIHFSKYDTDIHEKLKDNRFTIVKYEDVMTKAQKAMEEKPKKMEENYNIFRNGLKDLLSGKKPRYEHKLPESDIDEDEE